MKKKGWLENGRERRTALSLLALLVLCIGTLFHGTASNEVPPVSCGAIGAA